MITVLSTWTLFQSFGHYSTDPILLTGFVQVSLPCGAHDAPLFAGQLTLDVAAGSVDVVGATADVSYDCVEKTLSVETNIESVEFGPAALTDVHISLLLYNNLTYFDGNFSGSISFGDLMPGGLPGVPDAEDDKEDSGGGGGLSGGVKVGRCKLASPS